MPDALLITQPWLDALLQGQVDGILKSRPCRQRGEVYLALTGTGLVTCAATLVCSGRAESQQLEHPLSVQALQSKPVSQPHWWRLESVRRLDDPWTLSADARRGCSEWVPSRRWEATHPRISTKRRALRPWPKRLPGKNPKVEVEIGVPDILPAVKRKRKSRKRQREDGEDELDTDPGATGAPLPASLADRGGKPPPAWHKLVEGRSQAHMFLLHEPQADSEDSLSPQPGLTAERQGQLEPRTAYSALVSGCLADVASSQSKLRAGQLVNVSELDGLHDMCSCRLALGYHTLAEVSRLHPARES